MEFSSPLIRWTTRLAIVAIAASATVFSPSPGWTADVSPEASTPEPMPRSSSPSRMHLDPAVEAAPDALSRDKPMAVSPEKPSPVALPWAVTAAADSAMTESAESPMAAACTIASCLGGRPGDDGAVPAWVTLPEPETPAPAPDIAQAAEEAASSQADLARASQNPIASLISVPLQNNTNFGVGQFDRTSNILNVQPVIPVPLSENLTLVNRTIIPISYQPELAPGLDSAFGLGDINYTGFFVPTTTGNFTWGVGPSILLPTATDTVLGTGKWSVGPAAVGLVTQGPIVAGGLVSQLWSFAGDSDSRSERLRQRANVSLFTFQPFFNYNFDGGWYLTTSPIITANWAASSDQWTVPLGGGGGRVFNIGSQPVNASLAAYWNAVKPEGAADWTLRAQLTFLFP